MTAVVLVGDFPSTGVLQATVAQRVAVEGHGDEAAPAFVDHMEYALRRRGAVLVLYPAWKRSRAQRLVRLARSALLTDRIAGLPLDVPPLALSLVADQLTFASAHARPGVLATLAHRLCATLHAGAWVNSVARLEHVKTGLGAHVSSYLPGGGFSVTAGAHPEVHRITAAKPVPRLASRPADPVLMLVADANGDAGWLQSRMRPVLAAVTSTAVAPQPMSAEYWGTKKYTEFVAFSGHPHALRSLLAGSSYRACGWCGEPTALPECPFCLMVQPAREAAPTEAVPPGHPQRPHPQPSGAQPPRPQPLPPQPLPAQPQPPAPQHVQRPAAPPQPSWPQAPHPPAPHPVQPPQVRPDEEAPPTRPQYPHHQDGGPPSAPPDQTDDAPSLTTLLDDAAPRRSAAPDSPPERTPRTTPDDEWREGTVIFRPQRRR
ncbi:hypothetical protein AB0C69_07605 [Actinomadura sp. NPDC048032]|uniref:hypothetical protein n=1 Tax=Actinomadura sp. NPDC048032 TaxID=3155747 RepID=UPI0033FA0487